MLVKIRRTFEFCLSAYSSIFGVQSEAREVQLGVEMGAISAGMQFIWVFPNASSFSELKPLNSEGKREMGTLRMAELPNFQMNRHCVCQTSQCVTSVLDVSYLLFICCIVHIDTFCL